MTLRDAESVRSGFIGPRDREWVEMSRAPASDIYHLPDYVDLEAQVLGGTPIAYYAESDGRRLLIPLVLRNIPFDDDGRQLVDVTSPNGYPGPLYAGEAAPRADEFIVRAAVMFLTTLREQNVVSAFVRMNPMVPINLEPFSSWGKLVHHGDTVSIDLTLPEDRLWSQMRSNHRRDIGKSERAGMEFRVDSQWVYWEHFFELYHDTMKRLNAGQQYRFPMQYFAGLRRSLHGHVHLAVAKMGGEVVSAGLFSEMNGTVQYLFSDTSNEGLASSALKTMLYRMALWSKDRGNTRMHLGGGTGGAADNLFVFKAGFSGERHSFHTWRSIVDESTYVRLVDSHIARTERMQTQKLSEGFFPAYRA